MGKIAFLFAGQGAQHPGMGQALYQASPAARQALDASEQVRPGTLKQCFQGPEEELTLTLNTQPCLFAVDYACAAAARERGIEPDCLAGFSLGEVAAAAFGGVFSFGGKRDAPGHAPGPTDAGLRPGSSWGHAGGSCA